MSIIPQYIKIFSPLEFKAGIPAVLKTYKSTLITLNFYNGTQNYYAIELKNHIEMQATRLLQCVNRTKNKTYSKMENITP